MATHVFAHAGRRTGDGLAKTAALLRKRAMADILQPRALSDRKVIEECRE